MFAGILADAMAKVAIQIQKGQMTPEDFVAVHSVRGIYDFKGTVYGDQNSIWAVLYSGICENSKPVYSRVVFMHPGEKINDAIQFITDSIQTIGLAAEGAKATDFATKPTQKGAVRFPVCGKRLNFELLWDGMFNLEYLVKWNTLGGSLI